MKSNKPQQSQFDVIDALLKKLLLNKPNKSISIEEIIKFSTEINQCKTLIKNFKDITKNQERAFQEKIKRLEGAEEGSLVYHIQLQLNKRVDIEKKLANKLKDELQSLNKKINKPNQPSQGFSASVADTGHQSRNSIAEEEAYLKGIKSLQKNDHIMPIICTNKLITDTDFDAISGLIYDINKILGIKTQIDNMPEDVKKVLAYIKDQNDKKMLNHIVRNISINKVSSIFDFISSYKDESGKCCICSDKEMLSAQKEIFSAVKNSMFLKLQHAGRIALTVVGFIILTPFSLLATIPWVRKKQHETFVSTRVVDKIKHAELKEFRLFFYKEKLVIKNKSAVFNAQRELKGVKKDIPDSNKIKIEMQYEQAQRFDRWLKMKEFSKQHNQQIKASDEKFILKSKEKSQQKTIDNRVYYNKRINRSV